MNRVQSLGVERVQAVGFRVARFGDNTAGAPIQP